MANRQAPVGATPCKTDGLVSGRNNMRLPAYRSGTSACGSRICGADKWQRDCGANNPAGRLSTRQQHLLYFRRGAKNCIESAKTADAPRQAAAAVTAADPINGPAAAATAATGATAASAATAATTTAAAATTTSTASATTTASSAAAAARYLHEAAGAVFLVKEVECRKAHVDHFLFTKNEALIGRGVQRLRNVRGRKRGCGCASHQ
jgi:hypothetical protein